MCDRAADPAALVCVVRDACPRVAASDRTARCPTISGKQLEAHAPMATVMKIITITAGILLTGGASFVALADTPSAYAPLEGTVLSTHIPAADGCPGTVWSLAIGPGDTVLGTAGILGTNRSSQLTGSYDSHGTFHLKSQETGRDQALGTVDAQVQSDGSLVLRMTNLGGVSRCANRTVYLPWFRNGNDFDPDGGVSGGF
jgi:hypothetical protein